jgi:hypothetical protein
VELRDRLKLQGPRSKHTFRHREQILRAEKAELRGDMEFEQIYLIELLQVARFHHLQSAKFLKNFLQLMHDYLGQE